MWLHLTKMRAGRSRLKTVLFVIVFNVCFYSSFQLSDLPVRFQYTCKIATRSHVHSQPFVVVVVCPRYVSCAKGQFCPTRRWVSSALWSLVGSRDAAVWGMTTRATLNASSWGTSRLPGESEITVLLSHFVDPFPDEKRNTWCRPQSYSNYAENLVLPHYVYFWQTGCVCHFAQQLDCSHFLFWINFLFH